MGFKCIANNKWNTYTWFGKKKLYFWMDPNWTTFWCSTTLFPTGKGAKRYKRRCSVNFGAFPITKESRKHLGYLESSENRRVKKGDCQEKWRIKNAFQWKFPPSPSVRFLPCEIPWGRCSVKFHGLITKACEVSTVTFCENFLGFETFRREGILWKFCVNFPMIFPWKHHSVGFNLEDSVRFREEDNLWNFTAW